MYRSLALLCLLCPLAVVGQTVYKRVLPDGSVQYSDRAPGQAVGRVRTVEPAPVQTYDAPSVSEVLGPRRAEPAAEPAPAFAGYDEFTLLEPADGEPLRANNGHLAVRLHLAPALVEDHVIEIYVDGAAEARGRATEVTIENVSRGVHTIHAAIHDGDGNEVTVTEAVTVEVLRTSLCHRLRPDRAACYPRGPCKCDPIATP